MYYISDNGFLFKLVKLPTQTFLLLSNDKGFGWPSTFDIDASRYSEDGKYTRAYFLSDEDEIALYIKHYHLNTFVYDKITLGELV